MASYNLWHLILYVRCAFYAIVRYMTSYTPLYLTIHVISSSMASFIYGIVHYIGVTQSMNSYILWHLTIYGILNSMGVAQSMASHTLWSRTFYGIINSMATHHLLHRTLYSILHSMGVTQSMESFTL